LGIGSRHLRRLFLQHLGASPIAIAHTRRLHFAKKLIDETRLEMREIAFAAGFGSVRRFNDAFQRTYHRAPTHLRSVKRGAPPLPENEYRFSLRFRPPFCWGGLLDFLAPRAIPGVEAVEDGVYYRIFSLNDHIGWLEASLDGPSNAVSLHIRFPEPRWLFLIVERVRRMFDLSADSEEIASHLRRDPVLADRVASQPGLRIPGCWDGFELAVRAILGQQVTVAGASTLSGRLVRAFGTPVVVSKDLTHIFPAPEKLAASDLSKIGLPKARAECIRLLARAVRDRKLAFSGAVKAEEFLSQFSGLPGIGPWTAQYVLMRALGEPDAFPSGDLGLLRALGLRNPRELECRAQRWRPWRAYAAMYVWQGTLKNEHHLLHPDRKPARAVAVGGR
jgi:AraC family transcriptional regulator of adaptative response / DNA-3-methyladenine glycosylase II